MSNKFKNILKFSGNKAAKEASAASPASDAAGWYTRNPPVAKKVETCTKSKEELTSMFEDLMGSQKEVVLDRIPQPFDKEYVCVMKDGHWIVEKTKMGYWCTKDKKSTGVVQLQNNGFMRFESSIPKIPGRIFRGIHDFFVRINNDTGDEVMAIGYYNTVTGEWKVDIPVQRVAKASISYDQNPTLRLADGWIKVLDVHSHNTMGAFFSGVDTANEVGTGIYAVIGKVDQPGITAVIRAGHLGNFIDGTLEDFVDMSDEEIEVIPDSERSKIAHTSTIYAGSKVGKGYPQTGGYPYSGGYYTQDLYGYGSTTSVANKPINSMTDEKYAALYGYDAEYDYYGDWVNVPSAPKKRASSAQRYPVSTRIGDIDYAADLIYKFGRNYSFGEPIHTAAGVAEGIIDGMIDAAGNSTHYLHGSIVHSIADRLVNGEGEQYITNCVKLLEDIARKVREYAGIATESGADAQPDSVIPSNTILLVGKIHEAISSLPVVGENGQLSEDDVYNTIFDAVYEAIDEASVDAVTAGV